jgi:hypothetical protein
MFITAVDCIISVHRVKFFKTVNISVAAVGNFEFTYARFTIYKPWM